VINSIVADKLKELSVLLDLEDKPWESRAFRDARTTITDLDKPVSDIYDDHGIDGLERLANIGSGIASVIADYLDTGSMTKLDDLKANYPDDIITITRIRGIGPSTTRTLLDEFTVNSIDDLKRLAENNEIRRVDGLGEATETKILDGVPDDNPATTILLADADHITDELTNHIDDAAERCTPVGEQRRRTPTVDTIHLLVQTTDPSDVFAHVESSKYVDRRIETTDDQARYALIKDDHPLVVHTAQEATWGSQLHEHTGPADHVEAVGHDGAAPSEAAVYDDAVIPPEQRHHPVSNAKTDDELIVEDDIKGDIHMHSTWSDGRSRIEDLVAVATQRGYEYIAITDHSQSSAYAGGLQPNELEAKNTVIDDVNSEFDLTVLTGSEVDILPDGSLDYDDKTLDALDVVVASIHSHFDMAEDEMTERIISAVEHPSTTCIGHLTGRLLLRRDPYPVDVERVLRAAAQNDVAVEINSTPARLDINAEHAAMAAAFDTPVFINTDSHQRDSLHTVSYGVDQARRAGLPASAIRNTKSLDHWL
jgi:DNA polymerase (family 10)